ncbi:MAG: hypothetical protein HYV07_30680 [Deltaproteobacteria bacterium]|nr:hypothetical protein [Deltaproteobacteria bacterium]
MTTPKISSAKMAPRSVKVEKAEGAKSASFAELLAQKQAPKKNEPRSSTEEDPRKKAVMDKLAQSLLGSALGVSKEKQVEKDKAVGGLEGDE